MKGKYPLWIAAVLAALAVLLIGSTDSNGATTQERRIAQVLSAMEGAGKVEVALYFSQQDSFSASAAPAGAVIVAQGAEDLAVRLNLIRAVRTLLGLSEQAVDVFLMEGD